MYGLKPAIVVAAYNREHSLSRLLAMLSCASYPEEPVALVISIDGGGSEAVRRVAERFEWLYGEKRIIQHEQNLGLREHILRCGDLTEEYGAIVMLEDDLAVSPAYYLFASAAAGYYSDTSEIAQVSLYAYEYGEISLERFHPIQCGQDAYFMQWASSWGQLWTIEQWGLFREWYSRVNEADLQGVQMPSYVKGWPSCSWKKFYIAYLCDTGRYVVFPYVSYSSCYGDSGTNMSAGSLPVAQTPLALQARVKFDFPEFGASTIKYDAFFQPTKELIDGLVDDFLEYDYQVDFQGHRDLKEVQTPYLLSVKECEEPLSQFSWNVYPFELNLPLKKAGMFSFGRTVSFRNRLSAWRRVKLILWSKRILGVPLMLYCAFVKIFFVFIDRARR